MLQSIRDRSHGVASKIFVAFIVLIFAVFGLDSLVGSITNTTSVASVNGTDIDEYALEVETQNKTQELAQSLGVDIDISVIDPSLIREAALNDLIQQELLIQSALESGMAISSQSIDLQIARTPDFQINGVFDNVRAQTLLQSYGYTPTTYRTTLARERLLNQLVLAYSGSGFATEREVEQAAAISLQKRNLRYVLLSLDGLADGVEISNLEIEEYYQNNQDDFMREEQLSLEYLALDKNDIFAEVEVSEEAIRLQYDQQMAEYQSQIERRASHILIEASDNDEYLEAQALTEELKGRIDAGESFEELALEYSTDLGSAEDGGDLGYTTGDNFPEAFEATLQTLQVDEVSGPVRTEFGYHLIKLTDQSASEVESYDDLRASISRELQQSEVDNLYLARAEELNNLSFESLDLDDPAEILDLEKQTTDLFGRSGGIGIAANNTVINTAFSLDILEDELNSELLVVNDSLSVVIRLLDHNPSAIMELPLVAGEIDALLRAERAREQVRSLGETIIASVNNDQNINGLLEAQQLSWNQVNELQRSNTAISPELVENIFGMAKPATNNDTVTEGFQLTSGEYFVVELQEVIAGTPEDFTGLEEENIENFIIQQTGSDDFDSFLSGIQASATIR